MQDKDAVEKGSMRSIEPVVLAQAKLLRMKLCYSANKRPCT
jgi:hypothetical protein